jgi:hypothetical protein
VQVMVVAVFGPTERRKQPTGWALYIRGWLFARDFCVPVKWQHIVEPPVFVLGLPSSKLVVAFIGGAAPRSEWRSVAQVYVNAVLTCAGY